MFIGYIGLQFSSNLGQGPAQGLMPDRVAPEKLGVASGIKTFMDMAALIVASLAAGRLLDPDRQEPNPHHSGPDGCHGCFDGHHGSWNPGGTDQFDRRDLRKEILVAGFAQTIARGLRENTTYWWLIGQRLVFMLGIFAVQAFAQYYLQDVLESGKSGQDDR